MALSLLVEGADCTQQAGRCRMRSAGFSWRREFGRDAVARFLAVILGRWSGERGVSRFAYAHKKFTAASLLLVHTIVRYILIDEERFQQLQSRKQYRGKKGETPGGVALSPGHPISHRGQRPAQNSASRSRALTG